MFPPLQKTCGSSCLEVNFYSLVLQKLKSHLGANTYLIGVTVFTCPGLHLVLQTLEISQTQGHRPVGKTLHNKGAKLAYMGSYCFFNILFPANRALRSFSGRYWERNSGDNGGSIICPGLGVWGWFSHLESCLILCLPSWGSYELESKSDFPQLFCSSVILRGGALVRVVNPPGLSVETHWPR